jgi:sulfotransferase family protein
MGRREPLKTIASGAAAELLRLVPGSTALRWKRDLRDASWLPDADVVLISFPKSGRTFVRAMLARLFQRQFGIDERTLLDFSTLRRADPDVPRLLVTHAGDAMREAEEIRVNGDEYRQKKIILLARHPGDVAVSRYHHLKHRSRDTARQKLANQPLEAFVWSARGGIPAIVKYLNEWAGLRRKGLSVTIVRYEDFLIEPQEALGELAAAIGLSADSEDIADAVEFANFRNLKRREQEGYFQSTRLRPAKEGDERSSKVRAGGSGGYRARLGEVEAERIDAYIRQHLDPVFGYSAAGRDAS